MNLKTVTLFAVVALLIAVGWQKTKTTAAAPIMQSVNWQGEDFAQGDGLNTAVSPTGLTLADGAMTAVYISDPITTIPFNALVTSWETTQPTNTSLEIQVRTRQSGAEWSQWFHIDSNPDFNAAEDTEHLSDMITVPAVDETHDTIQFSVSFGRFSTLTAPELSRISFTIIDTTDGPTAEEMVAQQQALDAASGYKSSGSGYPRPTVISREVWCISVDCDYSDGLVYDDASHMIVHHTVSSNSSSNWAATVRAIWAFHTYPSSGSCSNCRGWGDIGYNYLIDQDGLIYEGHINEDYANLDVVGTHASGANSSSMGVSLIGLFTAVDYPGLPGISPPEVMKTSLIELLSWKADQRDINVYDASATLPFVEGGRPNLIGHRDVYGTTECPGDQAHTLLPWLRDQVAANIGLVDPYFYVDEDSAQFTKSVANWYEGNNECGHNGHSFYTFSTTNPAESANWGIWRPEIPEDGYYSIEVYVPYCPTGGSETDGVTYEITHANGMAELTISQEDYLGLWLPLGEYLLNAGSDNFVYLDDLVTTDDGLGLWFDGMRLLEIAPPLDEINAISPINNSWLNDPQIDFSWEIITTTSKVLTSTLTVSTDISQTNKLVTETWATAVLTHTVDFVTDQPALYWQATAVVSNTEGLTETISTSLVQFGIDMTVPTSTITAVYQMPVTNTFLVKWSSEDALSGLANYSLDYRVQEDVDWTGWLTGTTAVQEFFTAPDPAQFYEFRVRASDVAGNSQLPDTPAAALSTEQAIPLPHAIMIPIVIR
ncbi:MAG: hypothetical protein GY805_16755 [Chloroflexi bacterium]|nr:hypothetical protein [Chloroflexota bacterium]